MMASFDDWYRMYMQQQAEIDRLRTENAALRKDAERYRWLRDVADAGEWEEIGHHSTPDTTDAAIDTAMARGAQCRTDGRCQYAIDHGAEGLGHCPAGKCVMARSAG